MDDYREALESLENEEPEREDRSSHYGGERYGSPSEEAMAARRELVESLHHLTAAAAPGWERATNSGKVKAARLMDPLRDPNTLFDRYDPGASEEVSTSIVILADQSGSMGGHIAQVSEAIWAISHAAAHAEIELTILGFSTGAPVTLRSVRDGAPSERVALIGSGGGTDPTEALRFAWRRFQETEASHRVLITLSDGEWHMPYGDITGDEMVAAMREEGVITAALLLEREAMREARELAPERYGDPTHGAEIFVSSESGAALSVLFGEITERAMSGALMASGRGALI
jgi:Mg-chelatase subunit ChlD